MEQAFAGSLDRAPNVILILTDDQGYGDLACHGNPVIETPHLDELHAKSVRLTDHVDMLPTLIELCGLNAPDDLRLDGTSLVPLLRGQSAGWPNRTLVAELQLEVDRPVKWQKCAVMTDRWRLVDGRELYDIEADPGQKSDLAAKLPAVVESLRAEYEKWWSSVSENHDRIPEIVLGSDRENPTRLTAYHWNNTTGEQRDMPWAPTHIVAGPLQNGYWWVDVAHEGTYLFRLRRSPEESGLTINEISNAEPPEQSWHPVEPGSLVATRARLKIQDVDVTLPVKPNAEEVTFKIPLKAGSAILQTWFSDEENNSRGAYYVSVERLP